jgi:hypothetical protein
MGCLEHSRARDRGEKRRLGSFLGKLEVCASPAPLPPLSLDPDWEQGQCCALAQDCW